MIDPIEATTNKLRSLAMLGNGMAKTYLHLLLNASSEAEKLRIVEEINNFVSSYRPPWERGPQETKDK